MNNVKHNIQIIKIQINKFLLFVLLCKCSFLFFGFCIYISLNMYIFRAAGHSSHLSFHLLDSSLNLQGPKLKILKLKIFWVKLKLSPQLKIKMTSLGSWELRSDISTLYILMLYVGTVLVYFSTIYTVSVNVIHFEPMYVRMYPFSFIMWNVLITSCIL